MQASTTPDDVPRGALIALGALIGASLIAVAAVQLTGIGASHTASAAPLAVRELRFEDRLDGSIAILDAKAERRVATVEPGSNGFLRGTMRGLARERKREGVSAEQPFRLLALTDGRLVLEDPSTARRIDLGSFGPTNAAVFARLLAPQAESR